MSAGAVVAVLHRSHHRFGGTGTIVTLADGRAFTAAHCLAAVDGARGVVVGDGVCAWRVRKRWSPRGCDVAILQAVETTIVARHGAPVPDWPAGRAARLPARVCVRPGTRVAFAGYTGRRFQLRAATVLMVTATSATAVVEHAVGVCANDSGGPVFADGVLVGIVTHRAGPAVSAACSRQLVFARLDSLVMRRRIRKAVAGR